MSTVGYLFILVALLLIRGVTKGRSLTQVPSDLGDLFTAVVSNDLPGARAVLARTGDANAPALAPDTGALPADSVSRAATTGGGPLLTEVKRLGKAARGYKWGATGPDYYDCSGLVWRAMKNLGIYTGLRFTTLTFPTTMRVTKIASQVATPQPGDIVVWSGHMGVVDGTSTYYSALSVASGILSEKISNHTGTPSFWRINVGTTTTQSANAAEHSLGH